MQALHAQGRTVREIEELTGISKSRVATILAEAPEPGGAPPNPTPAPAPPSAEATAPPAGPALPRPKLEQLADVVASLPLRQQDAILARLPLDRLRLEAVLRGLAQHPAAAADVARELRAVEV